MEQVEALTELKLILREHEVPYFEDEEICYYLNRNNGDIKKAAYELLVIKAEDTTITTSGLNIANSSAYFLRLASKYRPSNTGLLSGVY